MTVAFPNSLLLPNAVILEAIARMVYFTLQFNENAEPVGRTLDDKHRKHGSRAYYQHVKES